LTASDLGANSVGTSELANNAVTSGNVKDNSLTASDLGANSVGASELVGSYESGSAYNSKFMGVDTSGSFDGLKDSEGSTSEWIRTTNNGILPKTPGGASSLGTSGWPFNTVHAKNFYDDGQKLATQTYVTSKISSASTSFSCTTKTKSLSSTNTWSFYTTVACSSGYTMTGGGITPGQYDTWRISHSRPDGNGWYCYQQKDTNRGTCYVRCCK
jgi:hypothetical protein